MELLQHDGIVSLHITHNFFLSLLSICCFVFFVVSELSSYLMMYNQFSMMYVAFPRDRIHLCNFTKVQRERESVARSHSVFFQFFSVVNAILSSVSLSFFSPFHFFSHLCENYWNSSSLLNSMVFSL